jgi:hypothetical protein
MNKEATMKKMKLAGMVLALVGIFSAGNVLAAGSTQVDVSATVLGTCSFNAANYPMSFGNISVTDTGPQTATANVQFTCTNNTTYTIDNVAGARQMSGPAAEPLAYTIAAYTTTAVANGALTTVALNGTIDEAAYQAASAGTYTETLTLNINP